MKLTNSVIGNSIETYLKLLFGWTEPTALWHDAISNKMPIEIKATVPLIKTDNQTRLKRGRFHFINKNHIIMGQNPNSEYCFVLYKANKKTISILGIRILPWNQVDSMLQTDSQFKFLNHKEIFGTHFTKKVTTMARIPINKNTY